MPNLVGNGAILGQVVPRPAPTDSQSDTASDPAPDLLALPQALEGRVVLQHQIADLEAHARRAGSTPPTSLRTNVRSFLSRRNR